MAATTEALIAELHARTYSWEALERAGLNFSSVQEEELLSWLKRDAAKFNEILTRSSLGLETQPTMQLLRTLSRRADLATALKESGLGSGSDFQCSFDESPRDGGCQIKCDGGRTSKCDRAERKCRELGHCVRVDLNRDHTWATLKSLQVYMPAPPPVCDGYAFGANGSAPVPIEAPLAVEFDDLGPGGAPREEWCYRDTTVPNPGLHVPAGRGCRLETCFDLDRCRPRRGDGPQAPLRVFIDTPTPKTYDMRRWPECMRQTLRGGIVERPEDACLVVPTVNINCEWDVCDPSTHSMLAAMPSWGGKGHNHVVWDYIDNKQVKYRYDEALLMKTSMALDAYRPGFDLPMPLLPNGEAARVTPRELRAAQGKRTILASFKGVCQAKSRRPMLERLHNGRDLIMLCTEKGPSAAQYDFKTMMLTSVFSVAPAGNGFHSFRLAEAIFFGSIPVIVDPEVVLPFCGALDWRRFSVRIAPSDIPKLPEILRAIPPERIARCSGGSPK